MYPKRPAPLYEAKPRPACPVCGCPSYSKAGIHPQCARKQADEKRMHAIIAQRKRAQPTKITEAVKPLHRRCPKCRSEIPIQRAHCDCGHHFTKRQR